MSKIKTTSMSKETIARINRANEMARFFEECAEISIEKGDFMLAIIQKRRAREHRDNALRYARGEEY